MKHSLGRPRNASRDAQLIGFPRLFESRPMREPTASRTHQSGGYFHPCGEKTRIAIGKAKKASRLASSPIQPLLWGQRRFWVEVEHLTPGPNVTVKCLLSNL